MTNPKTSNKQAQARSKVAAPKSNRDIYRIAKYKPKKKVVNQPTETAKKFDCKVEKRVHHCSFLRPQLAGFTALALSPSGNHLVAGRTDHSLVLARYLDCWIPACEIPCSSGDPELSISCIKFSMCGRYVFVARLDGTLSIFRLSMYDELIPHLQLIPGGGALWDIHFEPLSEKSKRQSNRAYFHVAVACDDGSIRFISPDENYLSDDEEYSTDLTHYIIRTTNSKSEGRVLCIAWSKNTIISGDSEGYVRWINVSSRNLIGTGNILSGGEAGRLPMPIWTIQSVLDGAIIVCGDDGGKVTFWSSTTMIMESATRIEGSKGPIWCSTKLEPASEDKWEADNTIVMFGAANGCISGIQINPLTQRSTTIRGRRVHSHDVRSIVTFVSEKKFLSASIDANLDSFSARHLAGGGQVICSNTIHFGMVGRAPLIHIVKKHNLLFCKGNNQTVEAWKLSNNSDELDAAPDFLLKMRLNGRKMESRAFAVSHDACFMAVSDPESFRFYRLWNPNESIKTFGKIQMLDINEDVEDILCGCVDIALYKDLIIAICEDKKSLAVYNRQSKALSRMDLNTALGSEAAFLNRVVCSENGIIAVSDSRGCVFTTFMDTEQESSDEILWQWKRIETKAQTDSQTTIITSVAISPKDHTLAFGTANGYITHATLQLLDKKRSKELIVVSQTEKIPFIPLSITIGQNGHQLLASDKNEVMMMSFPMKQDPGAIENESKKRTFTSMDEDEDMEKITEQFTAYPMDVGFKDGLWSTGLVSQGQIVFVERLGVVERSCLPDAIPKKVFG